jgi:hypothetical protein
MSIACSLIKELSDKTGTAERIWDWWGLTSKWLEMAGNAFNIKLPKSRCKHI